MTDKRRLLRIAIPIGGGAMVVALTLLLLYSDPLRRAILEPVTWIVSDVHYTLTTLPQALVWAIGLLIGCAVLLVAWRRLLSGTDRPSERTAKPPVRPRNATAVATLARDLARSPRRHISRVRVVHELTVLAVRLIAQREGLPLEEARKLVQAGRWPDDPLVRRFFADRRVGGEKAIPRQSFVEAVRITLSYLERYHQEV